MSNEAPPAGSTGFDQSRVEKMLHQSQFYENTSQEFIYTTADKLKLCLLEHRDALRAASDWIAPLGIGLTLLTTLLAADFTDFMGVDSQVWSALHLVALLATTLWLVITASRAIRFRGRQDINVIVRAIKQGAQE